VSGVTYAVGITAVVVVTALILLVRAGGPDP
jgi:hypothetical protein